MVEDSGRWWKNRKNWRTIDREEDHCGDETRPPTSSFSESSTIFHSLPSSSTVSQFFRFFHYLPILLLIFLLESCSETPPPCRQTRSSRSRARSVSRSAPLYPVSRACRRFSTAGCRSRNRGRPSAA